MDFQVYDDDCCTNAACPVNVQGPQDAFRVQSILGKRFEKPEWWKVERSKVDDMGYVCVSTDDVAFEILALRT
jgi:hypothetical protein